MNNIQNYGNNKMNLSAYIIPFFLFSPTLVMVFVDVDFMAAVEDDLVCPPELSLLCPPELSVFGPLELDVMYSVVVSCHSILGVSH